MPTKNKILLQCVLLSLLSLCLTIANDPPSVIIIGAGVSGIAAASKLLKNNISNVMILEAEDRIGGRIYSVPVNQGFVDLGAESVHGEEGNLVYEMVKDYNLLEHFGENTIWLDSSGNTLDDDLKDEIVQFIDEIEEQDYIAEESNMGEEFLRRYNKSILVKYKNHPKKIKIATNAIHLAENYLNCYEGSYSWLDLAIPNNYKALKGDLYQYWRGTGYKIVLDFLMEKNTTKPLNIERNVLLSTKVKSVDYSSDTEIIISCSNNKSYKANHVIFTPSLGVLKSRDVQFNPPLPEDKLNAIRNMGYGGAFKIILHFDKPWWDVDLTSFNFLWDQAEKFDIVKEFPRGPMKDGLSWLYYMESITTNKFSPNVLIAWFAGDLVGEMEKMEQSTVVDGIMHLIRKFMGNRYEITEPCKTISFPWISNPHFRGTYSYESTDIFKTEKKYQDILAYPLLNQKGTPLVLFAGEATHLSHYSTVHGAIETGYREADRIISLNSQN